MASGAAPESPMPQVIYQWNIIEYEWPNDTVKQAKKASGEYIPNNSAINGIKLYKDKVFVTVPRLRTGVPSMTLSNVTLLRPYPNWEMQMLWNCDALQRVQSMEVDPHAGQMWIVDTGYRESMSNVTTVPKDACPPKIIIFDINSHSIVHKYTFPLDVTGVGRFYLNDIVLGFENGAARYAYISDTLAYKLVVYDYKTDLSWAYTHPNMVADAAYKNLTIGNETTTIITGINGIALSPDYQYLYYSSVAGVGLHQIKTSVLISARGDTDKFAAAVRTIGTKVSPGDGMAYGSNHNLYYSALGENGIYKWDVRKDLGSAAGSFYSVEMKTHAEFVSDARMQWVDTLAIDGAGFLWFTTSRLNKLFSEGGVQHHEPNFYIWKVYVGDTNYMTVAKPTLGAGSISSSILMICLSVIFAACLL
ncbi:protein yellow-like [Dreissena polymorpha]|uniref:protein yellow-like n=1 Tax=Dreissena polymorpha TaxID=45954 RepID=UPI002264F793|nr:protein yellow-like [Dreissena polymorpha]